MPFVSSDGLTFLTSQNVNLTDEMYKLIIKRWCAWERMVINFSFISLLPFGSIHLPSSTNGIYYLWRNFRSIKFVVAGKDK